MPKPRKALISLEATPYYHCVSRCVRRAFLCGKDSFTGKDFEHRRTWIQKRLIELTEIFAIDLCGYAIMSNHVHTLLFINQKSAQSWDPLEVVKRWHRLFNGTLLSHRFVNGESLSSAENQCLNEQVSVWRARLMEISWFMRCLNEPIARMANKEDGCTGRFWEGRYKSQALLDERALAACLVYIDLNPIRAGTAETPEESEFTSIADRLAELKQVQAPDSSSTSQPAHLQPFVGNSREDMPKGLPICLSDYIELVAWTSRAIKAQQQGGVVNGRSPVLERLQIKSKNWLYITQKFESKFKGLVGAVHNLKAVCEKFGYRRTPNLTSCQELLV